MLDQVAPSAAALRREIRAGRIEGSTAGLAPGRAQGNVVILPAEFADDFARFCAASARAAHVIGRSQPGDPALPALGADLDIRHDLPRYRLYEDGVFVRELTDIGALWRDDLVTFVTGCSFSFERALLAAGIPVRHIEQERKVPMYRTNIANAPVGPFGGNLVVSMRPMPPALAARAAEITAGFPDMHGAPVHQGDPAAIGIADVARVDFGDAVEFAPGDIPVFWACGVTTQTALCSARLPFALTHAPGCMLITDLPETESAS
jgi:uncharacterized protein YcsI (UPF0317 family)